MQGSGESFLTIPQAALLLLASFLLQYVVGVALYDHRRALGLGEHELTAMAMLLAQGLLLATVLYFQDRSHRHLLHESESSALATTVLLVPPVLLLVPLIFQLDVGLIALLQQVFPLSQWEEQAFSHMVANSPGAVVATCILAPVLEEMLFRGVLLRSFLRQHTRWAAISASALLFGFAHLNIYQFALAFWLGLLLGWLYERSRSLIPCIALHGALNSLVVLAEQDEIAQPGAADANALASWSAALCAAFIGAWLLRRMLVAPAPAGPDKDAARHPGPG